MKEVFDVYLVVNKMKNTLIFVEIKWEYYYQINSCLKIQLLLKGVLSFRNKTEGFYNNFSEYGKTKDQVVHLTKRTLSKFQKKSKFPFFPEPLSLQSFYCLILRDL